MHDVARVHLVEELFEGFEKFDRHLFARHAAEIPAFDEAHRDGVGVDPEGVLGHAVDAGEPAQNLELPSEQEGSEQTAHPPGTGRKVLDRPAASLPGDAGDDGVRGTSVAQQLYVGLGQIFASEGFIRHPVA